MGGVDVDEQRDVDQLRLRSLFRPHTKRSQHTHTHTHSSYVRGAVYTECPVPLYYRIPLIPLTHCSTHLRPPPPTRYPEPNDDWLFNTIDAFSATCWHFAEHLTDLSEASNETVIPYGLISSQWGGTMVEHWIPNATLNAGTCKVQ